MGIEHLTNRLLCHWDRLDNKACSQLCYKHKPSDELRARIALNLIQQSFGGNRTLDQRITLSLSRPYLLISIHLGHGLGSPHPLELLQPLGLVLSGALMDVVELGNIGNGYLIEMFNWSCKLTLNSPTPLTPFTNLYVPNVFSLNQAKLIKTFPLMAIS